jgi:hypothetical protein
MIPQLDGQLNEQGSGDIENQNSGRGDEVGLIDSKSINIQHLAGVIE